MTSDLFAETLRPVDELHALLKRHGAVKTLFALPFAMLKPRHVQELRGHDMTPHLMRDIGLSADRGAKQHWELR